MGNIPTRYDKLAQNFLAASKSKAGMALRCSDSTADPQIMNATIAQASLRGTWRRQSGYRGKISKPPKIIL
jgi:hypothetical protein